MTITIQKYRRLAVLPMLPVLLFVCLYLFPVRQTQAAAPAAICYVDEDASGTGDGSSWANAYETLHGVRLALQDANCTQIWVAAGTYLTGYSSGDSLQLKNGVALYGGFAGTESSIYDREIIANETILSGNIQLQGVASDNSYHVVTGSGTDETAVLDGFTIAYGYADGAAADGRGGGMYIDGGNPTIRNVTFKENYAQTGGGLYNNNSNPELSSLLFISNTAAANGGGMYNGMSNPTLANVTFTGNQASNGGALYNAYSLPTLSNLTIAANSASSRGGGIYNEYADPTVQNSILWGNSATVEADQIYDDADSEAAVADSVVEGGFATGTGILTGDPLLGSLGDYGGRMPVIPIQPGSSALDAGNETTCTIVDQRGISRTGQGEKCDIGAFEYLPVLYAKPGGRTTGLCYTWGFACELRYALASAEAGKEIWVQEGTHYPTAGTDRDATFQLKSGVGVYGGFGGSETLREQRDWLARQTILSGDIGTLNDLTDNSYHVVTGSGTDGTAVLDGFVIKYGYGDSGGGLYNNEGSPTVRNTVFALNYGNVGGGMASYLSSPTLEDVQFIGNEARSGGGIHNYNSSPTLTSVAFTGNVARDLVFASGGNWGGGMHNTVNSHPVLTDVIFDGNVSDEFGGGMYSWNGSNPELLRVTFTGNSAAYNGGGMWTYGSAPVLRSVTFTQNTAARGGGMSNHSGATPILQDVRFIGNSADSEAGQAGDLHSGGGMYNELSSPQLISVTFRTNNAYRGGGIYDTESSPQLTDVTFDGNVAEYGGGMANIDGSHPTLLDVRFTNDSANWGGGMYNAGSNPSLTNVVFQGESATDSGFGSGLGGGMYNATSSPTLTDVTFDSNTSSGGGGMYNASGSEPLLTAVTFSHNDGSSGGGGAKNVDSNPQFVNVTFYSNTTNLEGGGLHNHKSMPTLSHVTFADNYGYQGGGIYNYESAPEIDNSIFWGNRASFGDQIFSYHPLTAARPILDNNVIEGGCPADADCTGVITADPALGPLGDHGGATKTLLPGPASSAMNSADDTYTNCPASDQRGVPRAQAIYCDIGAVERVDLVLQGTLASAETALLAWNDTQTVHEGYHVYGSSAPYGGYSYLSAPTALEETVAVTPNQPTYYEVYGLLGGHPADRSNRVGVFSFALEPGG